MNWEIQSDLSHPGVIKTSAKHQQNWVVEKMVSWKQTFLKMSFLNETDDLCKINSISVGFFKKIVFFYRS